MIRLQDLRTSRGLTQAELGKEIGAARTAIGNYERGDRQLDPETIGKICDLFGVTADYLLGRSDVPTQEISDEDWALVSAYRRASLRDRALVDSILAEYVETEEKGSAV